MVAVSTLFGAGAKLNKDDLAAVRERETRDGVRMISPIEYAALLNIPAADMAVMLRENRHQATAFTAQYGQYGEAADDYAHNQSLHGVASWNPSKSDAPAAEKVARTLMLAQFARAADPETLGQYVQLQMHEAAPKHVDRLVARSGVTEHRDFEGRTPLMFAAANSDLTTGILVQSFGADANAVDSAGRNAVAYSTLFNPKDANGQSDDKRFSAHVARLLNGGANPWARDKTGKNQLALAEPMLRQAALRDPSIDVEAQILRVAKVAMVRDTARQSHYMLTDGKQSFWDMPAEQRAKVMRLAEQKVAHEMAKMSRQDQLMFVKQADLGEQRPDLKTQIGNWLATRESKPDDKPRGLKR